MLGIIRLNTRIGCDARRASSELNSIVRSTAMYREYTDQEWAEWRREQERSARSGASPTAPEAAPAAPPGNDHETTLMPLPARWKVVIAPPGNNRPHPPGDFNVLQRDANRMLRKMYTQWQSEVGTQSATHTAVLTNAVGNQAVSNMALLHERQSRQDLEKTIEDLRAEADEKRADWERREADLRAKLDECKAGREKCEAELRGELAKELAKCKADYGQCKAGLRSELADVTAKFEEHKAYKSLYEKCKTANSDLEKRLERSERERKEFQAKCDTAFRRWAARRDELKEQVQKLQAEVALLKDRAHCRDLLNLL